MSLDVILHTAGATTGACGQWFKLVLVDLCREAGSETGSSVRRPPQCSGDTGSRLKTREGRGG